MRQSPTVFLLLLVLLLVPVLPLFSANPLQVSINGVAQCPIYYKTTTEDGLGAATDLKIWLDQITGTSFTVSSWDGTGTPRAVICASAAEFPSKASAHGLSALNSEGYAIWNESGSGWEETWVLGNSDLAIVNGVYGLLEAIGCRWFYPEQTAWNIIPSSATLSINYTLTDEPEYLSRVQSYTWGFYNQQYSDDWYAWSRHTRQDSDFFVSTGHFYGESSSGWIPPDTYFSSHPEWYAYWDGQRHNPSGPEGGQLCVSNTSMRAQMWTNIQAYIAEYPTYKMITVEPNDGLGFCECANCEAIGEGTCSDQAFDLANWVCDQLAVNYPGYWGGILSYSTHSDPPSFNLRSNMYVEMAQSYRSNDDCSGPPELTLEEAEASFLAKGIPFLGIYDYWSYNEWEQPGILWAGQFHVLGDRLENKYDQGYKTMWTESSTSFGATGPGFYLATKKFWDPHADNDAILDDFYTKAFGSASAPIKRLYERAETWPYVREELKLALNDLWEAYTLTTDPGALMRLDRVAMWLHYLKLDDDERQIWSSQGAGSAHETTAQELTKWAARIDETQMIHAVAFFYDGVWPGRFHDEYDLGDRDTWRAQGDALGLPTALEMRQLICADVNYYDTLVAYDIAAKTYTDDLVSINAERSDRVTPWGSPTPSVFQIEAGDFYFQGTASQQVTVTYTDAGYGLGTGTWSVTKVSDGSTVASGTIATSIQFTTPTTELYLFTPGTSYSNPSSFVFSPARPLSVYMGLPGIDHTLYKSWLYTGNPYGYFYVPKGATAFLINVPGAETDVNLVICTVDGYTTTALTVPVESFPAMVMVPVPAGKDAQIWRIRMEGQSLQMNLTCGTPVYVARTPAELLVPREAIRVEANNMTISTNESTTYNGTLSASQMDGAAMTYSIVTNGGHGTATITNSATGAFNYVPTSGYWGPDTFTFKVTDATGPSNTATVSVTVNSTPGGASPTGTTDSYTSTNQTINIVAPGVLANDTDSNGDKLSATLVTAPTKGYLTLRADGSFTYVPFSTQTAGSTDSFVYKATDGTNQSANTTVNLTFGAFISTTNMKAWFRADEGITKDGSNYVGTWQEKTGSLNFTQATQANKPLWVASGINGQPMVTFDGTNDSLAYTTATNLFASTNDFTLVLVSKPAGFQSGTPQIFTQGTKFHFEQQLTDKPWHAWWNNGSDPSADQNNDPYSGALMLGEQANLMIVNKSGTAVNTYLNGVLTHTGTVATTLNQTASTLTLGGAASAYLKGSIAEFIIYNRSLSAGDQDTLSAYLKTKYGMSMPPNAPTNDSYSTNEDTPLTVNAPGLLSNDTDPEKDALQAKLATYPTHGILVLNPNGGFTYTPDYNYNGSDSFTYKTFDGVSNSAATATVSITIDAVADAPLVSITSPADDATIYQPTPITLTATATDPDGGAITSVEFYRAGTTLIATDTVAPYECVVVGLSNATYAFTAKAYKSGANATSSAVDVTLATLPSPSTVSGLEVWFKADAGVTKNGSDVVSQWADQSGHGHHATVPAGGAVGPVWQSSGIAGQNALRYTGAEALKTTFSPGSTGLTFFYVAKTGSTVPDYSAVIGDDTTPGGIWWLFGPGSDPTYAFGWAGDSTKVFSSSACTANTIYNMSYRTDKTQWTVRNKGTQVCNPEDTSFPSGTYQLLLGADNSDTLQYPFIGDLAEVLVYTVPLSDTDLSLVETNMRVKYNTAPTANDKSVFIQPSSTYTGSLTSSDGDGDTRTYRITQQGTKGTAEITGLTSGAFKYTSGAQTGTDTIKFKVNDGVTDSSEATITVTIGNYAAPTATITSPSDESTLMQPAPIIITATASDSDGTVTKVEFYHGDTLIGTDTIAPYECVAAGLSDGDYELTAVAYDNDEMTGTSPVVDVTLEPLASPSTINNLEVWLKADAGITKNGSNRVSQWDDQSGNGHNATIPSGAQGPVWQSAGVCGQNSLRYTGSANECLKTTFSPGSTGLTFVAVTKTGAATLPQYNIALGSDGSAGTPGIWWAMGPSRDTSNAFGWAGSAAGVYFTNSVVCAANTFYRTVHRTNKTAWMVSSNGSTICTPSDNSFPTNTYQFILGADRATGGIQYPYKGDIAEVLVYTSALSDTDLALVEKNMRVKYQNPPVGTALTILALPNSTVTGMLTATGDGDSAFTYRITQQASLGTAEITGATTGAFQYTAGGSTGTDTFKVKVNDGVIDSAEYTVTVLICNSQDIGTVGVAGSSSCSNGTFTVAGGGNGITGTADAFRFVSQSISGNFTFTARVASFTSTLANGRAGVMARQSTAVGSIEASSLFNNAATKRVYFHRRTTLNGTTSTSNGTAAALPYWVRLVRTGNTLKSYRSANGTSWTQVGSNVTVTMTDPILVGLAVTNGSTAAAATATFDNISITSP